MTKDNHDQLWVIQYSGRKATCVLFLRHVSFAPEVTASMGKATCKVDKMQFKAAKI